MHHAWNQTQLHTVTWGGLVWHPNVTESGPPPRVAVSSGTLATSQSGPPPGFPNRFPARSIRIGTKRVGNEPKSTQPSRNGSKFRCKSSRDDGNVPGLVKWVKANVFATSTFKLYILTSISALVSSNCSISSYKNLVDKVQN